MFTETVLWDLSLDQQVDVDHDDCDVEGEHCRLAERVGAPPPVQPSGLPVLIGDRGERRTLRLVLNTPTPPPSAPSRVEDRLPGRRPLGAVGARDGRADGDTDQRGAGSDDETQSDPALARHLPCAEPTAELVRSVPMQGDADRDEAPSPCPAGRGSPDQQ